MDWELICKDLALPWFLSIDTDGFVLCTSLLLKWLVYNRTALLLTSCYKGPSIYVLCAGLDCFEGLCLVYWTIQQQLSNKMFTYSISKRELSSSKSSLCLKLKLKSMSTIVYNVMKNNRITTSKDGLSLPMHSSIKFSYVLDTCDWGEL